MIIERVAELVTSRLGRVDQSGLQQRTAGAVALFQASDHEPEKAGAGSAWCEIIGIEPVGDSAKSTVHVGVSMLLKRAPLITAVKQSYTGSSRSTTTSVYSECLRLRGSTKDHTLE